MTFFLTWILPPLMGAVIGYVTNDIAIKMLFRPLAEKRLFGKRIPFTPGLIPKQRYALSENIGKMVSRELLTGEVIRTHLESEHLRASVEKAITSYTDSLLCIPLGALSLPVPRPAECRGDEYRGCSDTSCLLAVLARRLIESPSLPSLVRAAVFEGTTRILAKTPRELIPSLSKQSIADLSRHFYPSLVQALVEFLNTPEMRRELEAQGSAFLRDVLGRLNSFQRFFVSAAGYDEKLSGEMVSIIDSLIERVKILAAAESSAALFSSSVADRVWQSLDTPSYQILQDSLNLHPELIVEKLSDGLLQSLQGFDGPKIARFLDNAIASRSDQTLGSLFGLTPDSKTALDAFLARTFLALAEDKIEAALESFDVKAMVKQRIDSLDVASVEHLVLDIMSDQFKWINLFGAVLGGLIGLIQVGLRFIPV